MILPNWYWYLTNAWIGCIKHGSGWLPFKEEANMSNEWHQRWLFFFFGEEMFFKEKEGGRGVGKQSISLYWKRHKKLIVFLWSDSDSTHIRPSARFALERRSPVIKIQDQDRNSQKISISCTTTISFSKLWPTPYLVQNYWLRPHLTLLHQCSGSPTDPSHQKIILFPTHLVSYHNHPTSSRYAKQPYVSIRLLFFFF